MELKKIDHAVRSVPGSPMPTCLSYLVDVALPTPLFKFFTYSSEVEILEGCRVEVVFGKRRLIGVSMGSKLVDPTGAKDGKQVPKNLRPILKVVDLSPIFTTGQILLAQWLEKYYFTPIGEIFHAMLPASQQKKKIESIELTKFGQELQRNFFESSKLNLDERLVLKHIFGIKLSSLTWKTAQAKLAKLNQLREDEFVLGQDTLQFDAEILRNLSKKSIVNFNSDIKIETKLNDSSDSSFEFNYTNISEIKIPELTKVQKTCADSLEEIWKSGDLKPVLLFGITGSGKTELYLHMIQKILAENAENQVLVMVPEIALTPQMTRIFETRFGSLVAVVHSAMEPSKRWAQLQKIRNGNAKILIGPRSSVFAPFVKLNLIIVDEEHDGSYKQQGGFAYHGRDVAVLRAKIESAKVLLGSATPSLESFYNAKLKKYHLLQMLSRANRSPLPEVQVVQQNPSFKAATSLHSLLQSQPLKNNEKHSIEESEEDRLSIYDFVSETSLTNIKENFQKGFQTICLVNRRGFSYFVLDLEERKAVACECCSVSLTFHFKSLSLKCHYCDLSIKVKDLLEKNPHKKFATVGFGSEHIEQLFKKHFADLVIQRLDSDTAGNQRENLNEILQNFRDLKTNLLIGTQILAKGHDFPKVTLIVLLSLDQTLDFPDFRAGEKVFQLLVQASGRAGRGDIPGKVILETHRPDHPVVQLALKQDYLSFAERELSFRQSLGFPPYTKIISIEFSSPKKAILQKYEHELKKVVRTILQREPNRSEFASVRISGPSAPPIEVVRGRIRRTMLFISENPKCLNSLVAQVVASIPSDLKSKVRMNIDVDPQFMM